MVKMLTLGLKMSNFPYFWAYQECSLKIKNIYFYPFSNTFLQIRFQKNLVHKFRKSIKKIDFGSKNAPFTPFWALLEFFSNNWLHQFCVFIWLELHGKNQEKVMSQSWKNRITDGLTEKAEFTGFVGCAGALKKLGNEICFYALLFLDNTLW